MARRRTRRAKKGWRKKWGKSRVSRIGNRFNFEGLLQTKIRYQTPLVTDAAGTIQNYINMTDPTKIINGAGTASDWTNLSGLYDSYRVRGVSIKFIPDYPNDTSVTTGYQPIYIVFDPDGAPAFTITDFIQYERCKFKNLYRPWKFYHYVPKMINPSAQTTPTDLKGGWMDIAGPQSTCYINFYAQNLDVSTQYGQLLITYYVQYKTRR